jgi:hypothetical protein
MSGDRRSHLHSPFPNSYEKKTALSNVVRAVASGCWRSLPPSSDAAATPPSISQNEIAGAAQSSAPDSPRRSAPPRQWIKRTNAPAWMPEREQVREPLVLIRRHSKLGQACRALVHVRFQLNIKTESLITTNVCELSFALGTNLKYSHVCDGASARQATPATKGNKFPEAGTPGAVGNPCSFGKSFSMVIGCLTMPSMRQT